MLATAGRADAADCAFEPQGEGRVTDVIDARSFRLDDGREVRLIGIERGRADKAKGRAALAGDARWPRGDVAQRGRHAGPLRPPARLRVRFGVSSSLRNGNS